MPRPNCEVKMDTREQIINLMARTLFVAAYADYVEDPETEDDVSGLPTASMGADWFDVAAELKTPESALQVARKIADDMERLNGLPIDEMFRRAAAMEPQEKKLDWGTFTKDHRKEPTLDEFAYCTAMQSLGHGVGWSDDHPDHGFELPRAEYYVWKGDIEYED